MTLSQVLAYDPTTQKIYCTYSDAYSGNTLAVLNLSNRTRDCGIARLYQVPSSFL